MEKTPSRKKRSEETIDLIKFKTYAELKAWSDKRQNRPVAENWAILERMRQLRYGYEPGTLKMDKTVIRLFNSMEEFRAETEREYAEEIKKYGPR